MDLSATRMDIAAHSWGRRRPTSGGSRYRSSRGRPRRTGPRRRCGSAIAWRKRLGAPASPAFAAPGPDPARRGPHGPQTSTAREILPALGFHELLPAAVEAALVLLARAGLGHIADQARELEAVVLEVGDLAPPTHLVVVRVSPRDGASARGVRVVPVLHVVL